MTNIVDQLIVDQLRAVAKGALELEALGTAVICEEGAAEIERLQEQIEALRLQAIADESEVERLHDEVERLRRALQSIADYTPGTETTALLLRGCARNTLEGKMTDIPK